MMKWVVAAVVIWSVWMLLRKPKRKAAPSPLQEARSVLGVDAQADENDIRAAHRRLMSESHPDRGGSDAHARRVNAARDTLLADRKRP